MFSARHRAPARRAARQRFPRLVRLAAVSTTVTATVVGVGLASGAADQRIAETLTDDPTTAATSIDLGVLEASREERASRSGPRVVLLPSATDHEFATAPLNVWTEPREQGKRVGLVKWGTKLAVTGQVVGHWAEILVKGDTPRWVNNTYLAEQKPEPEQSGESGATTNGISGAPCPDGSSIESGITSNAVRVYRAVCAAFPSLSTYGGYDPHGEHADGRAIDIMISGSAGQAVADWLVANAGTLQVRDVIYAQRIWTPEQASAGWRYMEDRGSPTANHYDHVHVAVF